MPNSHPFTKKPHRTLIGLSIPVFFSLVAEPLTGIVDTAFVAQLGSAPLAALGVGTVALSSVFWIFSFLGVGTQTEVAQALGRGEGDRAKEISSLALALSAAFGLILAILLWLTAQPIARALAAEGDVLRDAVTYVRLRLIGGPAILMSLAAFGTLRGLQDMRTPSWIAVGVNVLNIGLDALLITGLWGLPAMGVAGAALASSISQWIGAAVALIAIGRKLGFSSDFSWRDAGQLLVVGRDLVIRTAALTGFLLFTTRIANEIGEDGGAAHQAVRQVFLFTTLSLDAFAVTVQSLVGYFLGANNVSEARRVVQVGAWWSLGVGAILGLAMWLLQDSVIALMVPASAVSLFIPAWLVAAASQPLGAFAFVTDGAHWGTGDYAYMRNSMLISTLVAVGMLFMIDPKSSNALTLIWWASVLWVVLRGVIGMIRIWPGIGRAPLAGKSTVV